MNVGECMTIIHFITIIFIMLVMTRSYVNSINVPPLCATLGPLKFDIYNHINYIRDIFTFPKIFPVYYEWRGLF